MHLTLGRVFNQSIDKLPQSITHLTLSNNYNYNLNLPSNIIINYY